MIEGFINNKRAEKTSAGKGSKTLADQEKTIHPIRKKENSEGISVDSMNDIPSLWRPATE